MDPSWAEMAGHHLLAACLWFKQIDVMKIITLVYFNAPFISIEVVSSEMDKCDGGEGDK